MALASAEITATYTVTGADGRDAGGQPDEYPIPGLVVTFTPPPETIVSSEDPKRETLITERVATTNEDGVLCIEQSLGDVEPTMQPGVSLPVLPDGKLWTVTVVSEYWPAQEYEILVSDGQELDLSDRVQIPEDPSSELPQWQGAVVDTLAYKNAAQAAAVAAEAARVAAVAAAASVPSEAELAATFVPLWKPFTEYLAGDLTASPTGIVATAKAAFTSGATYDLTKWTPAASSTGGVQVFVYANGAYPARPADLPNGWAIYTGPVIPTGVWLSDDEWRDNA